MACCYVVAPAQIYTAGSGSYPKDPPVPAPWEVSFGLRASSSSINETHGERLLSWNSGISAHALYYVTPGMGIGLEGAWSFPARAYPVVDKYMLSRLGGMVKFITGREESARSYMLLAAGITQRKAVYTFDWVQRHTSAYFAFGWGAEVDVWKSSFVGLEGRVIYNTSDKVGRFVYAASLWEAEARVCWGVRF